MDEESLIDFSEVTLQDKKTTEVVTAASPPPPSTDIDTDIDFDFSITDSFDITSPTATTAATTVPATEPATEPTETGEKETTKISASTEPEPEQSDESIIDTSAAPSDIGNGNNKDSDGTSNEHVIKQEKSSDTNTSTGNNSTKIPSSNSSSSSFFNRSRQIFKQASSTAQNVSASIPIDVQGLRNSTVNTVQNLASATQPTVQSIATKVHNVDVSEVTSSVSATASATAQSARSLAKTTTHSATNFARATQPTMQSFADNLSSMIPSRKYALPDRSVASQILMYRQLLHTECKPGLRLSRNYEATDAQKKVMHMPWWEGGVVTSKKMVISYDNLIVRVWLGGAIMPYVDGGYAEEHKLNTVPKDDCHMNNNNNNNKSRKNHEDNIDAGEGAGAGEAASETSSMSGDGVIVSNDEAKDKEINDSESKNKVTPASGAAYDSQDADDNANTNSNGTQRETGKDSERPNHIDTLIDSRGLPPIPHAYWVDRLGFQQTDPVTDFRSGGVLSLAMLAHMVEACPNVHARFLPSGDTHMLPFGITCINVTDMIAKFCMFSKSVERMDVLMSQKPFWKMFENPDSLLVLQEISMEILCNVVVELGRERNLPKSEANASLTPNSKGKGSTFGGQDDAEKVTVFDFAEILSRTEKRVNDDLLGSGPRSVDDLRAIHTRNCTKYMRSIEKKEQQARKAMEKAIERSQSKSQNNGARSSDNNNKHAPMKSSLAPMKGMVGNMGNVLGSASGALLNAFGSPRPKSRRKDGRPGSASTSANQSGTGTGGVAEMEEIDFAKAPVSESGAPRTEATESAQKSALEEAKDLLDFVDADVDSKTEATKKQFADLLGDTPTDAADYFTIDDEDLL